MTDDQVQDLRGYIEHSTRRIEDSIGALRNEFHLVATRVSVLETKQELKDQAESGSAAAQKTIAATGPIGLIAGAAALLDRWLHIFDK